MDNNVLIVPIILCFYGFAWKQYIEIKIGKMPQLPT